MTDVLDCAKYIIKHCPDIGQNRFDSNMKLQKLLFFADLVSLAKTDEPLFSEPIYAFEQDCVVEIVRLRFNNDFIADALSSSPVFTQEEYDVLNVTLAIYGNVSVEDLSKASHSFSFCERTGVVPIEDMRSELETVRDVLSAYEKVAQERYSAETINGVTFFYNSEDANLDNDFLAELHNFSLAADDDAYTVCRDGDRLVTY
ncbi:hypothetical protein FACS189490_11010 [Clostridia bacterium]|nr:hypothetical protein FACS189490_11010 [Clostridia bacterium]